MKEENFENSEPRRGYCVICQEKLGNSSIYFHDICFLKFRDNLPGQDRILGSNLLPFEEKQEHNPSYFFTSFRENFNLKAYDESIYTILREQRFAIKSFRQFIDIPEEDRKKIICIYLVHEDLVRIPKKLINFPNLEFLILKENRIIDGLKILSGLKKLRYIDLSKNKISNINREFCDLPNLEYLDFYQNTLEELPKEIADMKNLRVLKLNCNNIALLPESIGELNHLAYLDLNSNSLSTLPENFSNLLNLRFLDLQYNNFIQEPEKISSLLLDDFKINYLERKP